MGRYAAGAKATGAGSTTLPMMSLYAIASRRLVLREVHAYNTTATAFTLGLVRLDSAATQGTGLTEAQYDEESPAPVGTAFHAHSSTGPTLGEYLAATEIGAAIGAGVMWTFDAEGIRIPPGTANGVGVIGLTTPQICTVTFVWEE